MKSRRKRRVWWSRGKWIRSGSGWLGPGGGEGQLLPPPFVRHSAKRCLQVAVHFGFSRKINVCVKTERKEKLKRGV